MRILVACEESGVVTSALRAEGHEAWSCDILPTRGHPEWHHQGDVIPHLGDGWDMLIAFPPCTFLCNSAVYLLRKEPGRWQKMLKAVRFFKLLLNAPVERILIENSIQHGEAKKRIGRPYSQIIQPWQFGHPEQKSTCLWLKGVPLLKPTKTLKKPACGYWDNQTPSGQNKLGPSPDRALIRSTTYKGVAQAIARQLTK